MRNSNRICRVIILFGCLMFVGLGMLKAENGEKYILFSPDAKLKVEIDAGQQLTYTVLHGNDTVLSTSNIGLRLTDGTRVGVSDKVSKMARKEMKEQITAPFYRFKEFTALYNELDLRLKSGFGVKFRAYDQ